jgi:hypothetical protein
MPVSSNPWWPVAWASIVLAAAAVGGCEPTVTRSEVSGRVTLDSKPLAGVTVAFFPQTKGVNPRLVGRGTTDSAGRYSLSDPEGITGAVVGTNRVVVLPPKSPRSSGEPASGTPSPGRQIPVRYCSPRLSPLVVTVQAGGVQTIDVALTSK